MRKKVKTTEMAEGSQPVAVQRLLTVGDVSAILGLSKVTIYDLIKRGGLPTVKINGARRIQPSKLQTRSILKHSIPGFRRKGEQMDKEDFLQRLFVSFMEYSTRAWKQP